MATMVRVFFTVRNSSSEIEEIEENRTLMILYYVYCNVIVRNDFFTRSNNVWIDLRKRKDKFALEVDWIRRRIFEKIFWPNRRISICRLIVLTIFFYPSSVDVSLFIVVIRFVVDKMCAECVSQGLSARRSNHQADWMNELSFHWSMRKLRFRCPPLFCSNYPVSVYHLVFHRFHTLLYVRSNLALSFDPTTQRNSCTCTIYIKISTKFRFRNCISKYNFLK